MEDLRWQLRDKVEDDVASLDEQTAKDSHALIEMMQQMINIAALKPSLKTNTLMALTAIAVFLLPAAQVSAAVNTGAANANIKACFGHLRASINNGSVRSTLKGANAVQNVIDKEECSSPDPEPVVNGGYPSVWANAPAYSVVDSWGYYNRSSPSYVAFKVYQTTGYSPSYFGNANQWPAQALARGISIGTTPRVGSVAIVMFGAYGHAMYVEGVNSDGSIRVSQYDYAGQGAYSEMIVSATFASYFIYF